MAEKLKAALGWLAGKQKSADARLVTYKRTIRNQAGTETDSSTQANVPAVEGQTELQVEDRQRIRIERTDRDYMILVTDLKFTVGPTEPRPGDRIEDGSEIYIVSPIGGEQCFRLIDMGQRYRIHCKRAG